MTDTVVETTAPKSVGPGKVNFNSAQYNTAGIVRSFSSWRLVFYLLCNAGRKQEIFVTTPRQGAD